MNDTIRKLQQEAERIASRHPLPDFYTRFKAPQAIAKRIFYNNPEVIRLRKAIEHRFHEELGHGLFHSTRVSIDCAALILIEMDEERTDSEASERIMRIGVFAGLLHDICRDEKNHAECGAMEAEEILSEFPLSKDEVFCISNAIRNHEAFSPAGIVGRRSFQLVSDCLYDADKFRWGTDTFTHTLWYMADSQGLGPRELIEKFPWGMSGTVRIIDTFRTPTGRQYGPEIIETGMEIGKEIYQFLLQHYRDEPGKAGQ